MRCGSAIGRMAGRDDLDRVGVICCFESERQWLLISLNEVIWRQQGDPVCHLSIDSMAAAKIDLRVKSRSRIRAGEWIRRAHVGDDTRCGARHQVVLHRSRRYRRRSGTFSIGWSAFLLTLCANHHIQPRGKFRSRLRWAVLGTRAASDRHL